MRWWTVPVSVVVVVVVYGAVSLAQVWITGRTHAPRPAEAIVVLGAAQYDGRPSAQLAGRLDEVARLWPEGYATSVVVTGGRRPGDRFTEAEASARYLGERGVPAEVIVLENEGSSTYESLVGVAEELGRGATIVIVTDPFHALRSKLIAEELGLEVAVASTRSSVIGGWSDVGLHLREAAGVGLGRILGFGRLERLTG